MFGRQRVGASITWEQMLNVRQTRSYRVAIWVARFNVVTVSVWLWLSTWKPPAPQALFLGVWLVLAAGLVLALVLLRRSGFPFVMRRTRLLMEDARIYRQLQRDFFWFRRISP